MLKYKLSKSSLTFHSFTHSANSRIAHAILLENTPNIEELAKFHKSHCSIPTESNTARTPLSKARNPNWTNQQNLASQPTPTSSIRKNSQHVPKLELRVRSKIARRELLRGPKHAHSSLLRPSLGRRPCRPRRCRHGSRVKAIPSRSLADLATPASVLASHNPVQANTLSVSERTNQQNLQKN